MQACPSYVLVTPARDEAATIPRTIASVTRQTIPPLEWVIVDDGSTDGTKELVRDAAARHPWIRPMDMPPRGSRSFAAVVENTLVGIAHLRSTDHDWIGLLDADVEFGSDYFEQLIACFEAEPRLGLAGGLVVDPGMPRDRLPRNLMDVPGAVQFFRRACFERIGGLRAIPEGGWDGVTCAMARMHGFETRLVTGLVVDHLKPRNVSQGGAIRRKWQMGARDRALGYHPLFEAMKCLGRALEPPALVGAAAWWIGYCGAALSAQPRVLENEVIRHIRGEQLERLRGLFHRTSRKPHPCSTQASTTPTP